MTTANLTFGNQVSTFHEDAPHRRHRGTRFLCSAAAILAMIVTSIPVTLAAEDEDRGARPLGEVSPDKALVYLIRPSAYVAKWAKSSVYSDQVFLGTLRNSSYAFAYVEPGEHLLWSVMQGRVLATGRFEFIAGKQYHLRVNPTAIALVPEEEARGIIEEVKSYVTLTEEELEDSKKNLDKRWAKAQEKDAAKPRVAIEKMVAETPPADVAGKLRIPKGTTITLALLENVSSAWNQPGDSVRFRVVHDFVIEGTTFLHAGTNLEAKLRAVVRASGSGRPGAIDIAFPGVRAADGTPVPLVGYAMSTGKNREGTALGTASVGGLLGGLIGTAIKGGEALLQIGALYEATTPVDVWVDPTRATPPAAGPAGFAPPELALPSNAQEVECKIKTGCRGLDDVLIQLQSELQPSRIAIRTIDGRELPSPISASVTKREKDGRWTCTFPGWSVVRNLPLREGTASSSIQIEGSLENGTAFRSDTVVPVVVRQ